MACAYVDRVPVKSISFAFSIVHCAHIKNTANKQGAPL